MIKIATAYAIGKTTSPELAVEAVTRAMEKASLSHANSVLLFLTADFALEAEQTLRLISKVASCTQVIGCAALGVLTEEKAIIESPGAAAMVFGGDINLQSITSVESDDVVLTLASPASLSSNKMDTPGHRIGGFGFIVWGSGKVSPDGVQQSLITSTRGTVAVSQGVEAISPIMELTETRGLDAITIEHKPALESLMHYLPHDSRALEKVPLDVILAARVFGAPENAIAEGRHSLHTVRSFNAEQGTVTLSNFLQPGDRMFWAMRHAEGSLRDMAITMDRAQTELHGTPSFGLLFPCVGRGPYFYGGVDRDLELVKTRFPNMPIAGCYCNGQIGPLNGVSHLFQRATVLGLFEANERVNKNNSGKT
jgi:small ligand-binding sensory domain FIST